MYYQKKDRRNRSSLAYTFRRYGCEWNFNFLKISNSHYHRVERRITQLQLANTYRYKETAKQWNLIFCKAQIRTLTGWQEGLNKRQHASTYWSADTVVKKFFDFFKISNSHYQKVGRRIRQTPARQHLPVRKDGSARNFDFFKAQTRTITVREEGLVKRQLASTYRCGETATQWLLIFWKSQIRTITGDYQLTSTYGFGDMIAKDILIF